MIAKWEWDTAWDIMALGGTRFRVVVLQGTVRKHRYFKYLKNALRYAMRKVEEMEWNPGIISVVVSAKTRYSDQYITFGPATQLPAIAQVLLRMGEITLEEYEKFRKWCRKELSWKDVFPRTKKRQTMAKEVVKR